MLYFYKFFICLIFRQLYKQPTKPYNILIISAIFTHIIYLGLALLYSRKKSYLCYKTLSYLWVQH